MIWRRNGLFLTHNAHLKRVNVPTVLRRGVANATGDSQLKPYYITTPIFYPNSVPHIGHLHSIVIADIFARYARLAQPNRPVYFMTGTDEHGLKIQKAAQERGMAPLAFCDELSQSFRNLAAKANASNTRFSRTTEQDHLTAVQHLWRQLDSKGLFYKGKHEGWYSISDECFYTDTQVKRINEGGQEYCVSAETGSKVEWSEEENYMFRLSKFREPLLAHFQSHPEAIYPAQHYANIVAALSSPLDDLSVSRPASRLSWGIPVPNDAEHTIYVWIDALTVYLSASGYPWNSTNGSGTSRGWPPNIQIIGKDILRFHAIYFPAMLHALGLPLTQQLLTHSHWTVDQRKMSKSVGNVADPIQAIDEFGVDVVRYYLARVGGRFKDDVDWSHSQLEIHAKNVMTSLGNLYLRTTSKKIQQRAEDAGLSTPVRLLNSPAAESEVRDLLLKLSSLREAVDKKMAGLLIADVLEDIMDTLGQANMLMSNTMPWARSTKPEVVAAVYVTVLETLRICGILLQPFMPSKSELLLDVLGVPPDQRALEHASIGQGGVGAIRSGVLLFEAPKQQEA